jgi:hypothetical protein
MEVDERLNVELLTFEAAERGKGMNLIKRAPDYFL